MTEKNLNAFVLFFCFFSIYFRSHFIPHNKFYVLNIHYKQKKVKKATNPWSAFEGSY